MVDIETSGPVYSRHSMTELGAAVGSRARGVIDRFEARIRPVGTEVLTSRASFEWASRDGIDPRAAMEGFRDWRRPWLDQGATFVARPAAFDWPWVVHCAWTHLGENPFGFKAVCASSWFEARGKRFRVELPHIAVEDACVQLRHFVAEG